MTGGSNCRHILGLAVLSFALTCVSGRSLEVDIDSFQQWQSQHGRSYNNFGEAAFRQRIFHGNLQKIKAHNEQEHSFKMELNQFADLTEEEFRALYLGFKPDKDGLFRTGNSSAFRYSTVQAPVEIDWVQKGAVTGVKNQLFCGSCWAYSTTGSIEGVNYLYTGELVALSEQQLVDCDTSKDMGCSGGLMDYAFSYVIKNGGLDTESDYAYYSIDEYCNKLREDRRVVSINSFEDVPENSEADLARAVSQQPISVAICASQLQFYSSGVVEDCCTELDHGVLAVGYGEVISPMMLDVDFEIAILPTGSDFGISSAQTKSLQDEAGRFWLVKNSWGETWGENGYFRLRKDIAKPAGTCNIAQAASYPVKTSLNPRHVPEVCGFWGATECKAGTKCECDYGILDTVCLQWKCTPTATA